MSIKIYLLTIKEKMQIEEYPKCRICIKNIQHEPIKMTRSILEFLEQSLHLNNIGRDCFCRMEYKQNLCAVCFNKMSEFQDFYEQCSHADEHWRAVIDAEQLYTVKRFEISEAIEFFQSNEDKFKDIQVVDGTESEGDKKECFSSIKEQTQNYVAGEVGENKDIIEFEPEEKILSEPFNEVQQMCCSDEGKNSPDVCSPQHNINNVGNLLTESVSISIELTNPVINGDEQKKTFQCSQCDKSFDRVYDLVAHLNIHTGIRPHVCDVCGKSFRQKNILTTHQTLHYGKNVVCLECGKRFARKSQLILHNRMHKNEKPFECDVRGCTAAFRQRQHLIDHGFVHTGEKHFQCSMCAKMFFTRKRLQDHLYKVHSQYRYSCEMCEKTFLKPHMLRTHMATVHKLNVTDVSHLRILIKNQ